MVNLNESYKFGFEKLEVWQNSIQLSKLIYYLTLSFPKEETYGLTSQIKRAMISVSSNIAEGSSKNSLKDQARFSEIAFGSLLEVLNQIILAFELSYISEENYIDCRNKIEIISRQLNALKKSQVERTNK